MKYVHCTHTMPVKCKYKGADGKQAEIIFYPFAMNKYTGQPSHTGYTQVEEAVLDILKKDSNLYKSFTAQKLLTVKDKLPASVETAAAIIAAKDAQIAQLSARVAKLEQEAASKDTVSKADADKAVEDAKAGLLEELEGVKELADINAARVAELEVFIEEAGLEVPQGGDAGQESKEDKPASF